MQAARRCVKQKALKKMFKVGRSEWFGILRGSPAFLPLCPSKKIPDVGRSVLDPVGAERMHLETFFISE